MNFYKADCHVVLGLHDNLLKELAFAKTNVACVTQIKNWLTDGEHNNFIIVEPTPGGE